MMRIPGLESVGWALLNSFWQFGLLTLLYLVITARDSRFTPAIRHNIALVFSLAGSVWFLAGLFFGHRTLPALTVSALETRSGFFRQPTFFPALDHVVALLPWIYFSILFIRTANLLLSSALKRKQVEKTGWPAAAADWEYFIDNLRRKLRIRRTIVLRWTIGTGMARTYGLFRPVVLFPLALLNRLSVSEVEAILVHELAHIRRNDYLTHLWMSLFRFVFYFNPFASFLYNTVSCEREKACDDLVLQRSYPAAVYAQALMTLEQFRQAGLKMSLAASGHRPRQLADRIRRIAGLPVNGHPRPPLMRLMLAVMLTAFALYGFSTGFHQPKPGVDSTVPEFRTAIEGHRLKTTITLPAMPVPPPPAAPEIKILPQPALTFKTAAAPAINRADTGDEPEIVSDSAGFENVDDLAVPDNVPVTEETDATEPAYASKNLTIEFSYKNPETAPAPVPGAESLQPYVPSSSFSYPVPDSVPVIALQSLQQNKPAVVHLLAKWKALQLQQTLSRSLESRYLQLKIKTQNDLNSLPAKKEELKKNLQTLRDQMRIRKAEIDRLSAILAEEPVIYI